jgi:hypothetical protein
MQKIKSKMRITNFFCYLLILVGIIYQSLTYASVILQKSREDVPTLLYNRVDEEQALYPLSFLYDYYEGRQQLSQRLHHATGIQIGLAYTALTQYAFNGDHGREYTSGGFDLFGTWHILRYNALKSMIGFRLDSRHKITSYPPTHIQNKFNLLSQPAARTFNNESLALLDLWLEQDIVKDMLKIRIGKLNFYDVMNSYAFDSQNFYYINNVFNGKPSLVEPENGLGIIINYYLTKKYYLLFGLNDINGKDNLTGINTFLNKNEYLTAVEFGYRSSLSKLYHDTYHVYMWHADGSELSNTKSDAGVAVTAQKVLWNNITPFAQYSVNKGRATVFKNLAIGGVVFNNLFDYHSQSLGIAAAYGNSSVDSKGRETVGEVFYRVQLLPYVQITPDYQIIRTKVQERNYKTTNIFGLRFRVSL